MKKRNSGPGTAKSIDAELRERFGISTLALMENAGRAVAAEALRMIKGAGSVAVVCGKGNNGGDGFVCARHLMAAGLRPDVYMAGKAAEARDEAGVNLDILRRLGKKIIEAEGPEGPNISIFKRRISRYNLIVDALLGVGLRGEVRGIYKEMIERINASGVPVISVDIPSGLDADTGKILGACVKARKTVTFISGKRGMRIEQGPRMCGEIVVDTLGVPLSAVKSIWEEYEKNSGEMRAL
jgi:hydroxyethylthiazole kinase-like uncharacterized protein yjeF